MFKISGNKGFHIILPNSVTISTQFGWGNYCKNKDNEKYNLIDSSFQVRKNIESAECIDAELGIWNKDKKWITGEIIKRSGLDLDNDDAVVGNIDIEQWLIILDTCRKYEE